MPYSQANKATAREYMDQVLAETICVDCGAQPVEWHNPDHEFNRNNRVGALVHDGRPVARIRAEMDASVALCRSCHMAVDGRAAALVASAIAANRPQPPKPCKACGKLAKPTRRGLCNRCYTKTYEVEKQRKARKLKSVHCVGRGGVES